MLLKFINFFLCLAICGTLFAGGACSKSGAQNVVVNNVRNVHITTVHVGPTNQPQPAKRRSRLLLEEEPRRQSRKDSKNKRNMIRAPKDADPVMVGQVREGLSVLAALMPQPLLGLMSEYVDGDCTEKDSAEYIHLKKSNAADFAAMLGAKNPLFYYLSFEQEASGSLADLKMQFEDLGGQKRKEKLKICQRLCNERLRKLQSLMENTHLPTAHSLQQAYKAEKNKALAKLRALEIYQAYEEILASEPVLEKVAFRPYKKRWNGAEDNETREQVATEFIANAAQLKEIGNKHYENLRNRFDAVENLQEEDKKILNQLIQEKKTQFDRDITTWCESEDWATMFENADKLKKSKRHIKGCKSNGEVMIRLARASLRSDSSSWKKVQTPSHVPRALEDDE